MKLVLSLLSLFAIAEVVVIVLLVLSFLQNDKRVTQLEQQVEVINGIVVDYRIVSP